MENSQQCMRGVWLTAHGDFNKLEYRTDIPKPSPAKGQVLVRVAAAGVNNTDINTRIGWYSKHDSSAEDAAWTGEPIRFPRIQGAEVFPNLIRQIEHGLVKPLVAKTFQLQDITKAQQRFLQKTHVGKIVLTIDTRPPTIQPGVG